MIPKHIKAFMIAGAVLCTFTLWLIGQGTTSEGGSSTALVSDTRITNGLASIAYVDSTTNSLGGGASALTNRSNVFIAGTSNTFGRIFVSDNVTNQFAGSIMVTNNITAAGVFRVGTNADSYPAGTVPFSAYMARTADEQEVGRWSALGGANTQAQSNRTSVVSFQDGNNGTLVGAIGGFRRNPFADFQGGVVFYVNSGGGATTIAALDRAGKFDKDGNLIVSATRDTGLAKIDTTADINADTGYKFANIAGFTGVVTNGGVGSVTNYMAYAGGIVTNVVKTP